MSDAPAQKKTVCRSSEEIRAWLRLRLSNLLGIDPGEIGTDEPLASYGLGSVHAVTLSGELEEWLDRSLPPTLAYEYPTIGTLSDFLSRAPDVAVASAHVAFPPADSPLNTEPVAIIGMGCRFPGANGPDAFWKLLCEGQDAIRHTPPNRWNVDELYDPEPSVPGKMNTRWGGFIDHVDQFDAAFFGTVPREAIRMDPQQRMLLETTWEALEDAGLPAERLAGTRTGVFIGISTNDYAYRQLGDLRAVDAYTGTGNALSIAANRISYFLDLHGPSMAVDTACSSSLVAIHLACNSIWNGESECALAGGANLILSPAINVNFTKAGVSAPDGRCKTFDAAANGYVRGEGAAVVVLKRLSSAVRDGDRIYALIRGSAVNQDGRTNGLMAPNPKGQEAVVQEAFRRAGVSPHMVDYVEAHGTGTSLGDQIEVRALGSVLRAGREPGRHCIIGSVKSNIGHLEAAAGIAGLIKVTLALKNRRIPPTLHVSNLNPDIPFENLSLTVATEPMDWPGDSGAALAGVSSFGFGGTNAHVVLQERPSDATAGHDATETDNGLVLFPISAASPEALTAVARSYIDYLKSPDGMAASLRDLCYTASLRRSHHDYRVACVAETRDELIGGFESYLRNDVSPTVFSGRKLPAHQTKPVFVFSGQGSQWIGMARDLLQQEPVFRASLMRCNEAIYHESGWSVLAEVSAGGEQARLDQIDVLQPVLFAVQVALSELWQSWGVKPAAVIGHSMGEVAAAHVAGILSLEEAARIICARSRLLKRTSGRGGMLAVEIPATEIGRYVHQFPDHVAIAVSNSPTSTVLAADPTTLHQVMQELERQDAFCRLVPVDVAAHSPQMDALCDDLMRELTGITYRPAAVPFYSTVIGGIQPDLALDPAYWAANLRQPVLFWEATQRLIEDGYDCFVEISPNPILMVPIQQTFAGCGKRGIVVPSLRRTEPARRTLLSSLATLHSSGLPLDWKAFSPSGRVVHLPPYPWQRQRYWMDDVQPAAWRDGSSHFLLGRSFTSASGQRFWESEWNDAMDFLSDHRVEGAAVMPAAAYIEMALAAAHEAFGPGASIKQVEFRRVLILPENGNVRLQLALTPADPNHGAIEIYSSVSDTTDQSARQWVLHATAQVELLQNGIPSNRPLPDAIQASCRELSIDDYYMRLAERGLQYGPRFRLIGRLWQGDGEALAEIAASDVLDLNIETSVLHPALLDSCLQATGAAVKDWPETGGAVLPVRVGGIEVYRRPSGRLFAHARLKQPFNAANGFESDIAVADIAIIERGEVIAQITGLELRAFGGQRPPLQQAASPADWLYSVQWRSTQNQAAVAKHAPQRWIIFSDGSALARELQSMLTENGDVCTAVLPSTLGPSDTETFRQVLQRAAIEADGVPCRDVIFLWSLMDPGEDLLAAQRLISARTLHLVQALAQTGWKQAPRLWLMTRGAERVGAADSVAVAQAALWGLGKVIAQEHLEWRCTNVDLDPIGPAAEAEALFREIWSGGPDRYVALREDGRYVQWLCPSRTRVMLPSAETQGPFRVEMPSTGVLDDLAIRPAAHPIPSAGEIVIEVRAAGLNFLDVLKALALAPDVTGVDASLGAECAGIVVAVGGGVDAFRIGDEVVAIAPAAFATFAIAPALLAIRKPPQLSFEEAATIPIAFVTAYYALHHAARLIKGERVLIHAAAGGVGLAAIQVAKWIGAEIFATAGSPEKRAFVHALGARHVMDSRTLAFAGEIMHETGGTGVDVVLNSLAGEAIPKGLSVLTSHGRFIEIGKRDIYEDSRMGLLAFKRNLSFHAIDLARMCVERPAFVGQLLRDVVQLLNDGVFRALPLQIFPVSQAVDAFRHMAQAKHIGKIVLFLPSKKNHALLREDATYLITGGLGGLGMLVADWLVRRGARHLALVGRSAPLPDIQAQLDELRARGAEITVIRADVSDSVQVSGFMNDIRRTMPPLKGVIHAAGILDDGILQQLTAARFDSVAAPKSRGAWNLHAHTQDDPLEFFVMFSSVASVLGSAGQGNYAAANAFLDGLAHYRQSRGLPATSINWGPWGEVGLAARADRAGRLALQGFGSIGSQDGLNVLEGLIEQAPAQMTVLPVDLRRWPDFAQDITLSDLVARVLPNGPKPELEATGVKHASHALNDRSIARRIRETLWTLGLSERTALLEGHLREQVAKVAGVSATKVDVHQPLTRLGIDSLMGVELKNRIEREIGVALPVRIYLQGPTIVQLAAAIAEHFASRSLAESPRALEPSLPKVRKEEGKRYEGFGLNEIQQAYWLGRGGFFEMGNVAAHVYGEVDAAAGVDLERLSGAWQRLIERHEMLRAVVMPEGEQRILREVPRYEIAVEDLRGTGEAEAEERLEQIRARMSHQVRAAEEWPLFEIRASRQSGGRTRLHISLDLLIADAWSILLLMREWEQVYRNPAVELPRLELSFRDYVQAEAELEGTELRRKSERYWQGRIATLAGAPELALAQSPGAIERPRFVRRSGRLEAEAWQQLKRQAQQAGVTPSMLLCTAFAEVLGQWSKTQRFTINVTMFNRLPLDEQVQEIVGDFTTVNLLEVERRVGSFREQAERVQQQLWEDLEHRYWSGLQVMREMNRVRGGGAMAAMPVVFTSALAQGAGGGSETVLGWLGRMVYGISQTPQVWLDHQIYEDGGALIYNWDAVEELFAEGVLDGMFQAYGALLEELMSPGGWQREWRTMTPTEQLQERERINAAAATGEEIEDTRLEELFQRQVRARPEQEAVRAGAVRCSYAELERQAGQIGNWLRERGAGANRLVAVVMDKGWEQVAAVLGVMESGAAYLPVDAAVPAERLQYLLEHGEVELVLTQSWLERKLAWPEGIRCLAVDRLDEWRVSDPLPPALEAAASRAGGRGSLTPQTSDLAYVIYTSGSTGQPKGVMIDHRAAVNTIVEMNRRFGIGAEDRVLAVSALSFDLSVYDIFGTLAAGGTIVMPDAAAGPDPAHWVDEMSRHGVTLWNSVPALMEMLVEYVEAHPERVAPQTLRQVWLSGDWIPLGLPDRIRRLFPSQTISLGGATEASIWSIYHPIEHIDPNWKSIPYGRPLANQQWQVLNAMWEPCPVWVTGQLYIGGRGLAQGYWRDAEKTEAGFVRNPRTGERLYRTGDLGRYVPGGEIEFLGREDAQVKVQGHRIELGEIEAALEQHAEVRTAVVAAIGDPKGAKRLVAYVVPSGESAPETAAMRRMLEEKLPDYMIPSAFVTLSSLPLTANGKIDRRALPAPARPAAEPMPGAPMNEITRKVAELLASVLKVPSLHPDAEIADLGMTSLDMMRVANLLEETFGFRPRIGDLFRFTTAAALAGAIEQHISSTSDSAAVSKYRLLIDPQEREKFKTQQLGLRRIHDQQILIPLKESDESWPEKSVARRSYRQFSKETIPAGPFSRFMSLLREVTANGQSKHLYGSAGGIYAVQTYVHVKPDRIQGLRAGLYYYHPIEHGLVLLAPDAELPAKIHEAFVNRPIFEQAAFSLFLIARMGAIAPMYGEHSGRFAAIEAGLISELLEMSAHAYQIGLCQIGTIDFEQLRPLFDLENSDELIHSLVGGRVDSSADQEEGEF